ncbi:CBS domain-containing protein [Teichococcus coralli]|nr:CBS domain-containing protein [Pseudoroseomonas coralli]
MTRTVRLAGPDDTLQQAARSMAECDAGALPVTDGERLLGMVTDRDIVLRGVAEGKGPDTRLREVMTPEVKYCFEDEDLDHVARNMGEQRLRRLPVLNREKRLVGILSLGDIALGVAPMPAGAALAGISQPGGIPSQTGAPRP